MLFRLMPVVVCLCTAGAGAQPSPNAGPGAERPSARDQQRRELRTTVLQASRPVDPQRPVADDPVFKGRHLSPRELAEMREQLRLPPGENAPAR